MKSIFSLHSSAATHLNSRIGAHLLLFDGGGLLNPIPVGDDVPCGTPADAPDGPGAALGGVAGSNGWGSARSAWYGRFRVTHAILAGKLNGIRTEGSKTSL